MRWMVGQPLVLDNTVQFTTWYEPLYSCIIHLFDLSKQGFVAVLQVSLRLFKQPFLPPDLFFYSPDLVLMLDPQPLLLFFQLGLLSDKDRMA